MQDKKETEIIYLVTLQSCLLLEIFFVRMSPFEFFVVYFKMELNV